MMGIEKLIPSYQIRFSHKNSILIERKKIDFHIVDSNILKLKCQLSITHNVVRSCKMSLMSFQFNFHFLFDCIQHLQNYLLLQTPLTLANRPFSYCIDQAGLGAFTAKSGLKHYNPPPLTVMWMNFDSPNFPSLYSLSAIILFQTCSNKCILYVLLFHKCIKIKYKTVNMYGVFLWLVQSSSRWNTIHSHRNYHVQLLSVRVGEFCHLARSR